MKNKRTITILIIICGVLVITMIPGFIMTNKKSNIKTSQSALLNRKYVNSINRIELSEPDEETLILEQKTDRAGNSFWIGTQGNLSFPVDKTIITQFLDAFSKTRSLQTISESYSAWNALSLTDNQSFKIAFQEDNGTGNITSYSTLFFGTETADGTMVRLRTDKKGTAYQIQNDISSYLTLRLSSWADMQLFPYKTSADKTDVQSLFIYGERDVILHSTDSKFSDIIHSLFALRGSELYPVSMLDYFPTSLELTIKPVLSDKTEISIEIYKYTQDDNSAYFVKPNYQEAWFPQYLIEISNWTFERIKNTVY